MNVKRIIWFVKLALLVAIVLVVKYEIADQWSTIKKEALDVDFLPGPLAVLAFCGVMITSALVWQWLTRQMGDRGARLPLLGAYTYSQLGKYVPGKVVLLLMRLERSSRYGMAPQTCTLSTLLENALYMISGGLVGMLALLWHARELAATGYGGVLPASALVTAGLLACCHPTVFYGLVNLALRGMKRPQIAREQQLRMSVLARGVLLFVPCWVCGGGALWISTYCVSNAVPIGALPVFMGGFALSVISGMVSFLPGGIGLREAVLGLFITWELSPVVGHDKALVIAAVAACLQRLFQIVAEVLLGLTGAILSANRQAAPHAAPPTSSPSIPPVVMNDKL